MRSPAVDLFAHRAEANEREYRENDRQEASLAAPAVTGGGQPAWLYLYTEDALLTCGRRLRGERAAG